ncbi:ABC transporter ATP-binding protein [Enteractinococcus fodinae]|uniref:ABC-type Fe3+/spermidine/putrescine transport system ATPase subunit n=1 Tax=Enteractinococcus fodinae TaxID=684663 RepID=A0ABU2B1F4_9MICC|nr:ABC transporter ATP-binding protein [Enteractinococcus fodinae]MDR7346209.1 ABC-type Fe3+/spermidine/putrescine transport system ATPase subunit [Enteractinococcus fodinae]
MTAIELINIHLGYPNGNQVFAGAELTVAKGEILGVLGASGAGKSTLLRLIAGLQHPHAGTVKIAGEIADDEGRYHMPPHRRDCTMVFQDAQLFPHRSVAGNVAYGLEAARVPAAQRRRRVAEVLEMVDIAELADRAITELSGGQAQRVALARCLVIRPSVILFDEPLSALDRGLRQRLAVDIRELLKRTGTSAIYVTHDPAEATTVADRIAVVEHGQIQDLGPVPELDVSKLSESVASLLGGLGEVSGVVTAVSDDSTTIEIVDRLVVLPGRQGVVGDTVTVNLSR